MIFLNPDRIATNDLCRGIGVRNRGMYIIAESSNHPAGIYVAEFFENNADWSKKETKGETPHFVNGLYSVEAGWYLRPGTLSGAERTIVSIASIIDQENERNVALAIKDICMHLTSKDIPLAVERGGWRDHRIIATSGKVNGWPIDMAPQRGELY